MKASLRSAGSPASRQGDAVRVGALALLVAPLLLASCGDGRGPAEPEDTRPTASVTGLSVVAGDGQRLLAGRRSPEAFRVRALDASGEPVPGAVVDFSLEGDVRGLLSQPRALTGADGIAATFLLDPTSGSATLTARAGEGSTAFPIEVERAPGELRFAPSSGRAALPGFPHPDSVVRVRVLDTEGAPLAGQEVWFVGPRRLSTVRDTTDQDGWARTVIRETDLSAGSGRVTAFMLEFPELTVSTDRPLVAPAERVVLVSVDGLRADAIERYGPPTLSRLAEEGASTVTARTVDPSLTTPGHLSMLSSVSPEVHGIVAEELEFTPQMVELDPLFKNADERGVRARAFMAENGPLAEFEVVLKCKVAFGLDSLTLVEPSAPAVSEAAGPTLADPAVRLVFVHLPDPDLAGHEHGFESPEYQEAVLRVDAAVADIERQLGDGDLLIVTSDHGGGGAFGSHQHGSRSELDVRIPLLLSGARVAPVDLGEASILDLAPTALWALGFRPPGQYEGQILLGGFR